MSRRVVLFITLLLLSFGGIPARAQTTQAPYLYYFSDKLKAFVIERADGTDTRLLGAGLMPDATNVKGPGWSPSGKWFAWNAMQIGGPSATELVWQRNFLISTDNTRKLTLLDDVPTSANFVWAPHSDLLLITAQNFDDNSGMIRDFVALADPNADTLLIVKDEQYSQLISTSGLIPRWYGNNYLIEDPSYPPGDTFWVGDKTGLHPPQTFTNVIQQLSHAVDVYYDDTGNSYTLSASVTGDIVYQTDKALVVANLFTGTSIKLPPISDNAMTVQWSPAGNYGLLIGQESAWLISSVSATLSTLNGWSRANRNDLPHPLWSPDGLHALLQTGSTLYHIDPKTAQLDKVPIDGSADIGWAWQGNAQAFIYTLTNASGLQPSGLLDDFDTGIIQTVPLPVLDSFPFQVKLSPDRQHVLYLNQGPVLYDVKTHQTQTLRPPAASWRAGHSGEVLWHPDSQWALTFGDGLVSSGGYCCRFGGVVGADGQHQRNLNYIDGFAESISLNWLPPQVDLTTLPPALKKPATPLPKQVLKGTQWSFLLSWSPDGKQIAGNGGDWADNTKITLWNVLSGQATELSSLQNTSTSSQLALAWRHTTNGLFTPIVVLGVPTPLSAWMAKRNIIAISPDGRQAFAYQDYQNPQANPTGVYDAATGKLIQPLGYEFLEYTSASYSPDGHLLVVGTPNESPQIYDTRTWQSVVTLPHAAPGVAFSLDGKQLAITASWDVEIYDVSDLIPPDVICSEQQVACF